MDKYSLLRDFGEDVKSYSIEFSRDAYEWFEKERKRGRFKDPSEFLIRLLNLWEIAPAEAKKYKNWSKIDWKKVKPLLDSAI